MNAVQAKKSLDELYRATTEVLFDSWKDNRKQLLMLLGLSVIIGLVPYITNGAMALLVNELVHVERSQTISSLVLELVGVTALTYLVRDCVRALFQHYSKMSWIDRRQRYELALSEKLSSLDVATHEDPSFKDEVQVLNERGAPWIVANFLDSLIANAQNSVGVLTASALVLAIDWRFFLLIVVAALPALYAELRYGRGLWSIYEAQSEDRRLYGELDRRTTNAENIRELQTFQTTGYFIGRQRELLSRFLSAQKSEERRRFGLMLLSQVFLASAMFAILWMLVGQVAEGTLQVGTFGFALQTAIGLEGTVTAFLMTVANQRTDARLVASYYSILERQPYVKPSPQARPLVLSRAPTIEFKNVTFAYPAKPSEKILNDFSLTIAPGERVALVGANGIGKSTLMKLLCRFYDPTEGSVLIDGIDLREIELGSWYENLALLSQEFSTYRFKTWETIALGRLNGGRNQAKIESAARRASADSFIQKWKDTYDQQIGVEFSGGIDLSGGQKQKVALARTLYRNAYLTVLDEPTAHVDADSEQQIFDLLNSELNAAQSLILISHRFSTVRMADRICVLDNGRLLELGSHDELMRLRGTYARLFESQAKGYQ